MTEQQAAYEGREHARWGKELASLDDGTMEHRVMTVLGEAAYPLGFDDIYVLSDLRESQTKDLSILLTLLETRGYIKQLPGKRWVFLKSRSRDWS